jgi:hypothetical protein
MTALEQDEVLLLAGAAYRITWWGAFPGALLLTDKRLVFEGPWGPSERGIVGIGHKDHSIPLKSISNPRSSSRFPPLYYCMLWWVFFVRRQFRANMALAGDGTDYHFRVRDPALWIHRIETAIQGARRLR